MEPTSKAGRIRRTKKNQKKKFEFSKLIFAGVSILTISVVIFSCRMIYITGDLSPLTYLIPSVFAELATATGFYYRKAQKENEIKIPHYLASQGLTEGTVNPEDDPGNYGN
jgi:hypothetical protein